MRQLVIENKIINDNSDCFVIAEVGHNHQGSIETAKQIFDKATNKNNIYMIFLGYYY